MNREIKFRAWDKDAKKMLPVTTIEQRYEELLGGTYYFPYNLGATMTNGKSVQLVVGKPFLMQYTGVSDRRGVEVYESDILRIKRKTATGRETYVYVYCSWSNKAARFVFTGIKTYQVERYVSVGVVRSSGEVIGNVYSNPELLRSSAK